MALMTWSQHFVTGIESVDTQHKWLVDLINEAAPRLAEIGEAPARDVRPLLDRLAEYAVFHFKHEEALMLERGIDPKYLEHHCQVHLAFANEVTQMIQDASADCNMSGADLLRFLTSWLTFHILSEDQNMARQLRAIQAGSSPAAAYENAHAEDSSANTVLVGALVDLFSLVSQRNLVLKTLNAELSQAKSNLANSYAQLEVRVVERTRKLKQANEALEREQKALSASLVQVQQTQAQLLQSEKMAAVGQLAAGVAHEINNPIGFITSNFSSLNTYVGSLFSLLDVYARLESELPVEHPARLAVVRAREQVELDYLREDIPSLLRESSEGLSRVKRIVSDLRDISSIDASEWVQADVNYGLESALNVLGNELKSKAYIVKEFAELPPVHCIPAQLNQVFVNLLVNAAQAIEGKGVITLRTRATDDEVEVEVSDTGQGMSEAVQKRIFEPFYTTKPVGSGTGLGLSVAWDIIKRHGGRIEVKSSPGEGSAFTLHLPIKVTASKLEVAAA